MSKQGLREMDLFTRGASPKILPKKLYPVLEKDIFVVQCINRYDVGGGHVISDPTKDTGILDMYFVDMMHSISISM